MSYVSFVNKKTSHKMHTFVYLCVHMVKIWIFPKYGYFIEIREVEVKEIQATCSYNVKNTNTFFK